MNDTWVVLYVIWRMNHAHSVLSEKCSWIKCSNCWNLRWTNLWFINLLRLTTKGFRTVNLLQGRSFHLYKLSFEYIWPSETFEESRYLIKSQIATVSLGSKHCMEKYRNDLILIFLKTSIQRNRFFLWEVKQNRISLNLSYFDNSIKLST